MKGLCHGRPKGLHYILPAVLLAAGTAFAQVPYDRIAKAESEPANWLTYAGGYKSQRYTALDQINKQNVTQLRPLWVYQIRQAGIIETSPIVVDGVMYMTEPPSTVTALDVRTGRPLWSYTPKIPDDVIIIGSPPVNRGVAVLDNMVYVGTVAGHLTALDAKSGAVRWDIAVDDNHLGYYLTLAPLAIDGEVVVGVSGADTRFPRRANRISTRGAATAGRRAAARRGSRARTIRSSRRSTGRQAIRVRTGTATTGRAT